MPVLQDDALIMCLDDLPASSDPAAAAPQQAGDAAALQAQLEDLTKQFANYRLAVEQTLDKRWHADDDDDSSSTSSAAPKKEKADPSHHYWESYANHGMLSTPK